MNASRKDTLDAVALVTLVACCATWGFGQVASKVSLAEVPPLLQSGVRSLGAALLLLLWARARGLAVFGRDGTGLPGIAAGVLFAVEFACIFIGLQYTSASRMASVTTILTSRSSPSTSSMSLVLRAPLCASRAAWDSARPTL